MQCTIAAASVGKTMQHSISQLSVRCKASCKFLALFDRQLSRHLTGLPDDVGAFALVHYGCELRRRELIAAHQLVGNEIGLDTLLALARSWFRLGARRSSGLRVELDQPPPSGKASHLDRHDRALLSRAIENQAFHCRALVHDDRAYPPQHQHEWLRLGLEGVRLHSG